MVMDAWRERHMTLSARPSEVTTDVLADTSDMDALVKAFEGAMPWCTWPDRLLLIAVGTMC